MIDSNKIYTPTYESIIIISRSRNLACGLLYNWNDIVKFAVDILINFQLFLRKKFQYFITEPMVNDHKCHQKLELLSVGS